MTDRDALIREIRELPDFIVRQLSDIVHYIKLGIEHEYVSETDNYFYNSEAFEKIVSDSIADYRADRVEDMDILKKSETKRTPSEWDTLS